MKNIIKYLLVLGIATFGFTSCVDDLNVKPKDPNSIQYFDQNGIFTKIYATLGLTGQNGPDGNGDVEGIDEGVSAFVRMIFELNEFPTDEGWWIWDGDSGMPDLRRISWTSTNSLVTGIYYRLYFDVSLCNHFLEHASAEGDGEAQMAEVRFIRALNYYYLLDMFGSVPFALKVTSEAKPQYSRVELYNWLEGELKELETLLPAQRLSDYRVDRVAAKMLLARLYLNAEVYTGTAHWDLARDKAKEVMDSQYKLCQDNSGSYSAYQKLFMGDNHKYIGGTNGEGILNIYQDGVMTQCWGGARFMCSAFRDAGYNYFGISDTWSCFRTSPEFLEKWVNLDDVKEVNTYTSGKATITRVYAKPEYRGDEFQMPKILGDDRAILMSWKNDADTMLINGPANNGAFYECWSVLKWTGRYSIQDLNATENIQGHSPDWPDTDIPFMRVAEAYLTYAEAQFRLGQTGEATNAVKALRDRAHNTKPFTMSEQFLLDEWSREFYCEGRRRIDLVRFGRFAGPQADAHQYTWEGRGEAKSGDPFVSLEAKYNVFPLPQSDVITQSLTQTEGY